MPLILDIRRILMYSDLQNYVKLAAIQSAVGHPAGAAMNIWGWLAWRLAGFITGVAVASVVMWFGRDRIRARLARRR